MDIESILSDICENLKQQVGVHTEILKIANDKKEAIVQNETDKLKKITKQEQQVVFNIIDLEEKREKNVKSLSTLLNEKQEGLTISEIIKISKDKIKNITLINEVEKAKEDLRNIINELKTVNELNNQLIKNSLEYIDFNLNLMLGSTIQGTYGNSGEEANMRTPSRGFDKKY